MFILFSIEVTSCVSKQLRNMKYILGKFIIKLKYKTLVKEQKNEFNLAAGVGNKMKTPECVKTGQLM